MWITPLSELLGEKPRTVSLVRAIGPREHPSHGRSLPLLSRAAMRPDRSHLFGRFGLHPLAGWETPRER